MYSSTYAYCSRTTGQQITTRFEGQGNHPHLDISLGMGTAPADHCEMFSETNFYAIKYGTYSMLNFILPIGTLVTIARVAQTCVKGAELPQTLSACLH